MPEVMALVARLSFFCVLAGGFAETLGFLEGGDSLRIESHRSSTGSASVRSAMLAATISASPVACETVDCRLERCVKGTKLFGPRTAKMAPVVDLAVLWHPAKSLSLKSVRRH